ncbi:transmembrane and coiled-coil domains protein 2-like [Latimeria chalumnae]|uniref:transmembrane and coiled-coil domains protein 2-like n=1 Tax=Latimeria chalumnae TaxID=7897 RepID=UPI0006D8EB8E|nr:PREDICTED: transmembrane and coiled-coil domains protein 2-like [Latimeria chalumnae]|eukprot:XP_014340101.1 PREDICTED: transmembrane and coiled-coil domains protein 2-like [Latimeria chalumnae]
MKRCKSDDFQAEDGSGTVKTGAEDALGVPGIDEKPGDTAAITLLSDSTNVNPNPTPPAPTRSKPPDLKKIQQLSEGSVFGHGLKHLFHSRRRSREREHQNSQDSSLSHQHLHGQSDHDSADEKERSPEMHRVSYAVSLHDLPARPTAFNRVLQQIRSRQSIKRGTSLHSSSRRTKSGPAEPQKGSPHLARKAPQDSSLTAILQQHQGRPRSSSTTDTTAFIADSSGIHLFIEDSERIADKVGGKLSENFNG